MQSQADNRLSALTPAPWEGHVGLLVGLVSEVLPVQGVYVTLTLSKRKMMIFPKMLLAHGGLLLSHLEKRREKEMVLAFW